MHSHFDQYFTTTLYKREFWFLMDENFSFFGWISVQQFVSLQFLSLVSFNKKTVNRTELD